MISTTFAPLAYEKMIVSSIIAFVSIGLIGQVVPYLQRRYRFNNLWAWIIAFFAFSAVLALQALFMVPESLAPFVKQYDWVLMFMGFAAMTVFGALFLFVLFGGKGSDLVKLFKRR